MYFVPSSGYYANVSGNGNTNVETRLIQKSGIAGFGKGCRIGNLAAGRWELYEVDNQLL